VLKISRWLIIFKRPNKLTAKQFEMWNAAKKMIGDETLEDKIRIAEFMLQVCRAEKRGRKPIQANIDYAQIEKSSNSAVSLV